MKKRIKLTKDIAMLISYGVGFTFCAIVIAIWEICLNLENTYGGEALILILVFILTTFVSYYILHLLFKVEEIEPEELEPEETENKIYYEKFTEVMHTPIDMHESEREMFASIFQREGIKFYAKLLENNEILLVVKNKNDEKIYECEISNYYYFNETFSIKENP